MIEAIVVVVLFGAYLLAWYGQGRAGKLGRRRRR